MQKWLPANVVNLMLALGLASSTLAVNAQQPPPATKAASGDASSKLSESKRATIFELLKITNADANVKRIMDQMMATHQKQYPFIVSSVISSDSSLSEEQKKELAKKLTQRQDQATERMRELFEQKIDLADVMNRVALNVYDKYFTESELKDIVAFYKTPVGQKTLKVMPQVMQDSMDLTRELITPKLGEIIEQLMKEERAKVAPGPSS